MILALVVGCAARLHYEPSLHPVPPLSVVERTGLAAWFEHRVATARLPRVSIIDADGQRDVVSAHALTDGDLLALWMLRGRRARGAELDLAPPGEPVLTATVDLDGSVHIAHGAGGVNAPAASNGVDMPLDPGWQPAEVALVAEALRVLLPGERAALDGVVLTREARSRRAPMLELAVYDPRREPRRVVVYDPAFEDVGGFVGPVDAPRPAALLTLVHELAHAYADHHGRAVVRAYRGVWSGHGPTPYGDRNVHESFADAFALYHLDPAALQRVDPAVHAWFASGGHAPSADTDATAR